jgi:hypothetical protein
MDSPYVKIIDVDEDTPDEPEPEQEQLPQCTREFLLGGHAYFSVTNPKGERRFYVIVGRGGKRGTQWHGTTSYYLRAHQNGAYRYVGVVQEDGGIKPTGRSEFVKGTLEFDIAAWALRAVFQQTPIQAGYGIRHAEKCGKCARALVERGDRETGFHLDCVPHHD